MQGVPVVLSAHQDEPTPKSKPVRAETNDKGIAEFKSIADGEYELTTGIPHGETLFVVVENVQSDHPRDEWPQPTESTLQLRWPDLRVMEVKRVAGRLSEGDGTPAHVQLSLVDGPGGREISFGQTDSSGNFDLLAVSPGIYLLRVTGKYLNGDVAVKVNPDAESSNLNLELETSTCGLLYGEPQTCEVHPLQVANVCGKVVDPTGATIPQATVQLKHHDSSKQPDPRVAFNRKDASFEVSDVDAGEYSLSVSEPGFKTLIQPLRVLDGTGKPCLEPLRVTLALSGSCSKAETLSSH